MSGAVPPEGDSWAAAEAGGGGDPSSPSARSLLDCGGGGDGGRRGDKAEAADATELAVFCDLLPEDGRSSLSNLQASFFSLSALVVVVVVERLSTATSWPGPAGDSASSSLLRERLLERSTASSSLGGRF